MLPRRVSHMTTTAGLGWYDGKKNAVFAVVL